MCRFYPYLGSDSDKFKAEKDKKSVPPSLQKAGIWEILLKSTVTLIQFTLELTLQFTYTLRAFPYCSPFLHTETAMPMPEVGVQALEMAWRKVFS